MIDKTMHDYESAAAPRDKQALAMAIDRLFGTYAYMTGLERPGVSRGRKKKPTFEQSGMLDTPDAPALE